MNDSLDDIKKLISSKYLGKEGIHSIGISRSLNALRIYLELSDSIQQKEILTDIAKEATPFKVLIVDEKRSSITDF